MLQRHYGVPSQQIHYTQGMTVPFLVSSGIEQPIIGYNVIELLVKDEGSSASMQSAFPGLRPAQCKALVGFIQNNDSDDFCEVRLGKRDVLVPTGKSIVVMGRAHPGPVHEEMTVLFEPDVRRCWADDLQIDESVVKVSTGSCCKVSILVTNTGSRPVTLRKRTVLGRLQLVHSIMPGDLQPSVMAMSTNQPKSKRMTNQSKSKRMTRNGTPKLTSLIFLRNSSRQQERC